jgi:hypothetical protein
MRRAKCVYVGGRLLLRECRPAGAVVAVGEHYAEEAEEFIKQKLGVGRFEAGPGIANIVISA